MHRSFTTSIFPGALSLGIDVGSSSIKLALVDSEAQLCAKVMRPNRAGGHAAVLEALRQLAVQLESDPAVSVCITGHGREPFVPLLGCSSINDVAAAVRGVSALHPGARTVVDLGGQFSKWMLLGPDEGVATQVLDVATNGLCAAGSGAFLEQQASRLRLSVDELGQVAAGAESAATIAGRCSVFAKSDMIHLQQKGTPVDQLALGLCHAMVRTFLGTVVRGSKLEVPVVLIGGGACSPGIVRSFSEISGHNDLQAAADPLFVGAFGAALLADAPRIKLSELIAALESSEGEVPDGATDSGVLSPLVDEDFVAPRELAQAPRGPIDVWLGVDVGSVSTNLVVLGEQFEVLHAGYLATRGRPAEVLLEGMAEIREQFPAGLRVLGVGTTGSGRHLAAAMLGGDVVHNEITAQLVSAVHFVPEADTIFEIGGQDSKFISVHQGKLADFEMNKICSAGTGSFLEEQATRLGVSIYGEFAERAMNGGHPRDLGTRCTVFMDAELVRVQQRGASVEDICAGLSYSVARNYLDRVVAGRPIGSCIVFQGGTASNRAVVAAFRQLLRRPVHVHPYNRVSGAIGAAVLAARSIQSEPRPSRFVGYDGCIQPEMRTFECPSCENRCQVSRMKLPSQTVHFGDACERYAERDRKAVPIKRPFPELFQARARLLDSYLPMTPNNGLRRERVGLLRASLNLEFLPFWWSFLQQLGLEPVLSPRATPQLLRERRGVVPAESCMPLHAAGALAAEMLASGIRRIFMPSVLECPRRAEDERALTCLYSQQLGDMLRNTFGDQILTAQVSFNDGVLGLMAMAAPLARALGESVEGVALALHEAREAQERFTAERRKIGRQALSAKFDRAAVVLGKPYNTHDSFLNLSLARHLERIGLPAIPWDMLRLEDVQLPERWASLPWHYSREHMRALALVERDPRLFPIWISSYGCGPDGFTAKHLEYMLAGRPRLLLEFDEHRGEAGLVTRIEAFADEIGAHIDAAAAPRPMRVAPGREEPKGSRFYVPCFSPHAAIYAASIRSAGYEVVLLPPPDESCVQAGEALSSGRECHPFSIVLGELVRFISTQRPRQGDVLVVPSSENPCLINQYGDAVRIALSRGETPAPEVWDPTPEQMVPTIGAAAVLRLYEGLLATDVLMALASRIRPYEQERGSVDAALAQGVEEVAGAVARARSIHEAAAVWASTLWRVPRSGRPGDLPVVGITGDVYTRNNEVGNGGLVRRLEELGCEVWLSPFFAPLSDLSSASSGRALLQRGSIKEAMQRGLSLALTSGIRLRMYRALEPQVVDLVGEPGREECVRLASPYVGAMTNAMILHGVAKIVDFLQRGATGVVSAAGINCMAGVSMAAAVPAIRADHGQAPVISLACGGVEGPAQRIRLETFVHQVKARWTQHKRAAISSRRALG